MDTAALAPVLDKARQREVWLQEALAHGLLRVEGVGKATRYAVNVPGWEQPALKL